MKKLIAVFTACVTMLMCVPLTANAYSGSVGQLKWSYSEDTHTLAISGRGALPDYTESTFAPWKAYQDEIKTLSIDEGVTEIGDYCFAFCSGVESVKCPTTLRRIGKASFGWCYALENIALNSGLETIGDRAFVWCRSLTTLDIPDSVKQVGESPTLWATVFSEYKVGGKNECFAAADGVLFDKNMTTLVAYPHAKGGAYTIPDAVETVREEAFFATLVSDVTIPESVEVIEKNAFAACTALTEIHFKSGTQTIADRAFNGCSSLKYVVIPEGCASIGDKAFASCGGLLYAVLPKSVSSIAKTAFSDTEIKGVPGSYAQSYAKQNGLGFSPTATVILNGSTLELGAAPIIVNGSTLVPMRSIFEALGAEVEWDDSTKTAIGTNGGTIVKIQIGNKNLYKNGEPVALYQPASLIDGRTLVPLRAVSEAFDLEVTWNQSDYTVSITSK